MKVALFWSTCKPLLTNIEPTVGWQGTSEIKDLERQCEETLSKARSEAAALLDQAKKESTKEQQEAMDKAKAVRSPSLVPDCRSCSSDGSTAEIYAVS